MEAGTAMMIWCEGGPASYRRAGFPPPVEVTIAGERYVLHDEGPPPDWRYVFVTSARI